MLYLNGYLVFRFLDDDNRELIKIDAKEFEIENTWTNENRGMGAENGYESVIQINHPSNDKEYQIRLEFTEYPIGALNYKKLSIIDEEEKDAEVEIVKNTLNIIFN